MTGNSHTNLVSRREFLKLGGLAAAGLAFGRRSNSDDYPAGTLGRVSTESISVYDAPGFDADTVGYRFKDELLNIYYEVTPPDGPAYNPLWYRVWGGYVHSAYVQPVEFRYNELLTQVREGGQITEVTVPFSDPLSYSSAQGWHKGVEFRLYHGSTHWVTDLVQGPDKLAWYQITDELYDGFQYYVPAEHLRSIPDEEIAPISTDVPAGQKRIIVSRQAQTLTAYEEGEVVLLAKVSTGINRPTTTNGYPSRTPEGSHNIRSKMPSKHMGSGGLAGSGSDFVSLPGVPWTSFFAEGGYAIHGTYWHNNFGIQMSRGCVNMRSEDAKWVFRWLLPENTPEDWEKRGFGTKVIVT